MIAYEWLVWLILLFPLGAFVVLGVIGRRLPEGGGHVAVGAMAGSFVLSLYVFIQVLQQGGLGGAFTPQTIEGFVWIPSLLPENSIKISLLIDNLSALMLVLVSFLCLLIFIYSLGYMHEEEGKPRYYAEVSLFATGMLGTVSADNFLQLLIFWEIMGLCSYLLIGFWYHKPEAAAAAKKAFLVTRVGDVLFLIGVLVIWNEFGTLRFNEIAPRVGLLSPQLLTLIPLLLFGGAVGKSAQFPLHAWLPDAMEGPTTVSALIHAATMVKAGVYLTARAFIFLVPISSAIQPPFTAILVIAAIGGFTTLFAATMAVVNFDITRVLDDLPARLHVPRPRRGRVHDGDRGLPRGGGGLRRIQRGAVPSVQPRVLQGPPVPRRRERNPRGPHERHARDGRSLEIVAHHLEGHALRRSRPRRHRALQRLLLERGNPVRHLRRGRRESRVLLALGARRRHRVPDRVLHVPPVVHDVPRGVPRTRASS